MVSPCRPNRAGCASLKTGDTPEDDTAVYDQTDVDTSSLLVNPDAPPPPTPRPQQRTSSSSAGQQEDPFGQRAAGFGAPRGEQDTGEEDTAGCNGGDDGGVDDGDGGGFGVSVRQLRRLVEAAPGPGSSQRLGVLQRLGGKGCVDGACIIDESASVTLT